MSLALLIKALDADLSRDLPRNTCSFTETRARRPELAPFETLADLRRALDAASSLVVEARRALVTALVEEAQRGTSAVWSSLLVLAFAPMLQRLRKRTSTHLQDDDLDSAILAAFLGAVRSVPASKYTSLALRWATEKEIHQARRAERRLGPLTPFDDDIHHGPVAREAIADKILENALRVLEKEGDAEILDVLIATRGQNESLRDYVKRTCSHPHERRPRYQRLARARLRLEQELREQMAALRAAA